MKVEIWSDFVCPFCYIGHTKFKLALAALNLQEPVEVVFKSFQLDVNAIRHPNEDIHTLISKKYGMSYEQAKASNQKIIAAAKEVGLAFNFDQLKPNNTGLAHQAAKVAAHVGKEKEFIERLFKAYFEEGVDLGIEENLITLANQVGIEGATLGEALGAGQFKSEVLEDQQKARAQGISGVPHFIVNNRYTISGAQSVDYFKQIIIKAVGE